MLEPRNRFLTVLRLSWKPFEIRFRSFLDTLIVCRENIQEELRLEIYVKTFEMKEELEHLKEWTTKQRIQEELRAGQELDTKYDQIATKIGEQVSKAQREVTEMQRLSELATQFAMDAEQKNELLDAKQRLKNLDSLRHRERQGKQTSVC